MARGVDERVRVEDLFPGARAMFPARGRPLRALALALTAAVLLLLLGARLLRWADRNL